MILREFAVNPVVIEHWSDLKIITMNFGFHNGAVISAFPKSWIGSLKEKAKKELEGSVRYIEVVERLNRINKEYLVKRARAYSERETWSDNALQQHTNDPFYRIIDCMKIRSCSEVVVFDELDESTFKGLREGTVHRYARDIAEEARLLLECSKAIKLIDPFFSHHRGYKRTMKEILKIAILDNRRPKIHVEVHASAKQGGREVNINNEKEILMQEFPGIIPKSSKLKVFWWDDPDTKEIHPRYLITERGGIRFDRGFIEPNELTEKDSETDVSMMTSEMTSNVWNKYEPEISRYSLADELEIAGSM